VRKDARMNEKGILDSVCYKHWQKSITSTQHK